MRSKALRNLRRSWLSREVALFGAYAALAAVAVGVPALAPAAAVVGVAGVFASGRLYVVPGRPVVGHAAHRRRVLRSPPWPPGRCSPGTRWWRVAALGAQLAVWLANLARLARDPRREATGTVTLYRHPFGWLTGPALGGWRPAAAGLALAGWPLAALAAVGLGELIGRYLFYVTVVPLNIPGPWRRG